MSDLDYEAVAAAIAGATRSTRAATPPARGAGDAVAIDTTDRDVADIVAQVLDLVTAAEAARAQQ